jgi:NADPH2:quinone reductase
MKATWYSRNGDANEVLQVGELPTPEPGPGEVRVRLVTSGVNPSDVKSRRAKAVTDPHIVPLSDGAGVIDRVGAGVAASRVGERVWVWNGQWQRAMGTACEYIAVPEAQAVRLPEQTDFAAGACFGIPALTAIQAVTWAERLVGDLRGHTVLVTGASSAVGHYITQLVTLAGGRVIGTVGSPAKADHARAAGMQEAVFYKTESVPERIKTLTQGQGVSAIIDMDFSSTAGWAADVLKPHGQVVCYGSNAMQQNFEYRPWLFNSLGVKFFLVYELTPADRALAIARLTALLEQGALQHTIGPRFALDQMVQAHQAVEAGQSIGNVVVDIAPH